MIVPLIAGLLSRIGFNVLSIFWKKLRHEGLNAQGILSFAFLCTFFWPILAVSFLWIGEGTLSKNYLMIVAIQALLFIGINWLSITMFRYQGLTVADTFRNAFTTAAAFIIDLYIFNVSFDLNTLFGAILMLLGALSLQTDRNKNTTLEHLPLLKVIGASALIGILSAADVGLYKAGLNMQDNIYFHLAWVNLMIWPIAVSVGLKNVIHAHKHGSIKWQYYIYIGFIHAAALILYTYALDQLSVMVMSLIRIAGVALFVLADMRFKELSNNLKTYFSLLIIIIGLGMLFIT